MGLRFEEQECLYPHQPPSETNSEPEKRTKTCIHIRSPMHICHFLQHQATSPIVKSLKSRQKT